MKQISIVTGWMLMLFLSTACDSGTPNAESSTPCESSSRTVCEIPFELVYSARQELIGKNIRLRGVVVAGYRSEDVGQTLTLLFPSFERARICSKVDAIEITGTSKEISDEILEYDGQWISIAGKFEESASGEWGVLNARKGPALLDSEKHSFECIKLPNRPVPKTGRINKELE